jgi:hypothetical protein
MRTIGRTQCLTLTNQRSIDTPGQEHEDVEMAAMDAAIDARSDGRLVTPCDSRQARDLIILAESLNSFVDVPIEPDVDPSPR